jgi:hypothetical protein
MNISTLIMHTAFYRTADPEWQQALARLPHADVYFLPQYHHLHEANGEGTAHCFVAEQDNNVLVYPFLLRPIPNTDYTDIETIYGYSGTLATTTQPHFLHAAWAAFAEWAAEKRVITEFVRCHPLLNTAQYAAAECRITLDRTTVYIPLVTEEENLWASYPSQQRTRLRQAQHAGLICRDITHAEGWRSFQTLYAQTMQQLEARDYYYFSDAYFDHLSSPQLAPYTRLFGVFEQEKCIAAAVFLIYAPFMHYHLGGSDAAHRQHAPNNLLFHTAAAWGGKHGFTHLHLGGGRTSAPEDALLRFKKTLSHERSTFYIGRRVHQQAVYDALCAAWMQRHNLTERPAYFQLYRL